MLIFKTIPRVRTRSIAGVLQPWTAAWERYLTKRVSESVRQTRLLSHAAYLKPPTTRTDTPGADEAAGTFHF